MALNTDGINIIISGDGSQAIRELARVEQSINSLLALEVGSKLEAAFGGILSSIVAGVQRVAQSVAGVMRTALAVGGGFEAQMTAVKVISGATGEELEKLTQKAREMGATLPITAKDSAMAMTVLAQRGTSVKDILASVSDVANLAISQGVSMGAAADLLGSTITNFGLAMEDASKVTAIFNNASNQSALNMSSLTEALKYVGPTAGSVGMELTEAISAMEALANAGLKGEMIGTSLTRVITILSTKARIMGVETKDMQGKLRPLADIFSELQAKGFALTDADSIFGARGKLGAINLAKFSDTLKQNEERLKQWGSTQAAVDEKAKTFNNTMAAFSSAMEALHIEVFDQIKSQSKGVVAGITDIARAFADWVGQTKIAEQALNAFLDGLGFNIPAGADFKKLLDQIDIEAFVDRVKSFGNTIRSIADSIVSFAGKIQTPLLFLIKHLDTFATISFWGWITGKAIQIPAIIISLANSFIQLSTAIKSLSISTLTSLASNPVFAVLGAASYATYKAVSYSNAAATARRQAQKENERYLLEQANADTSLDWDIKLNIKTGFEKLPESWAKASDELREKANQDIALLQEAFRENVGKAIDSVIAKFPDMADALHDSAEIMSNSSLLMISKALQGNQQDFDALPPHLQKVTQELYFMGVQAGQTVGSIDKVIRAYIDLNKAKPSRANQLSDVDTFTRELSASVNSIIDALPDNLERLQKFLGNKNLDLAVNLSLEQAQSQIQALSKSLGEKFNIPNDIVSADILSSLQKLAEKGNSTAMSLINGWKGAGNSLDTFIQSAQDAVKYLGASPETFSPALNSLTKGIQKIDPLTGKVTEQFKKAYDALKQWGNVTFSQLEQRIQRLRRAVEGGFIDKSALEAEFKRVAQQVKIQIATELAPTQSSYNSREAFNSVVASEYVARMGELGGQSFMDLVQKEFATLYDKSGAAIGAAIMRQVDNGISSGTTLKIDGIDIPKTSNQLQSNFDFAALGKAFTDSVKPLISKIEQINIPQNDISSHFSGVIAAINKLQAGIDNNSSVITRANEAVLVLSNSIGNINTLYSPNTGAAIRDYSPEFANVVKEIQAVSTGLAAIQNIAQDNVNAVNQVTSAVASVNGAVNSVEAAVKSQQSSFDASLFSQALAPLISVTQNIASSSSSIQSLEQNRSASINEILSSIKDLPQNNNSSIDENALSQAIVSGLSSVLSKQDTGNSEYQTALNDVARNILVLQQSIDALKKSADSNINVVASLQNSLSDMNTSSTQNQDFSGALTPLVNAVLSLSATVSDIQSINQANSSAIYNVTNAVKAVESAVKSIEAGNNYDIDINQQGFIVQKKADADLIARNTASALRSGLGNGGV